MAYYYAAIYDKQGYVEQAIKDHLAGKQPVEHVAHAITCITDRAGHRDGLGLIGDRALYAFDMGLHEKYPNLDEKKIGLEVRKYSFLTMEGEKGMEAHRALARANPQWKWANY